MADSAKYNFIFISILPLNQKKKFFYLLSILLSNIIFIVFFNSKAESGTKSNIKTSIKALSSQDKEYLTNFFRYTFFLSTFGYTIFGEKPLSFETINFNYHPVIKDGVDYMDIYHILDRYKLRECWETWLKYSHFFPLKGYSIISYKCPVFEDDYLEISVINHNNFTRVVRQHISDFQTVLGKRLTPEEILEEYIKGQGVVFNTIRNHDGLFGTLLGFGRNNAWEYMRQGGGEKMDGNYPPLFNEPLNNRQVLLPTFAVTSRSSEETIHLNSSYERQREKINEIFQSPEFLEKVLIKLTQGN